jgi:hypothetical protein
VVALEHNQVFHNSEAPETYTSTPAGMQALRVTTLAIFSDSQAAIRRTVHFDSGPGQQLASVINEHARALRGHGIEVVIH